MLFVKLTPKEEFSLQKLERSSDKYRVLEWAKALLLSHQGYLRSDLAKY